jgi:phosphoenolpyruvate-protein phosphotransferase (PTS system enzyme I)
MYGIGASPGIAIGQACIVTRQEAAATGILLVSEIEKKVEIEKFNQAVNQAVSEVRLIQERQEPVLTREELDMLDALIEFITDPQLSADVISKITEACKTACDAVIETTDAAVEMFNNLDDAYLQARAADVREAGDRIISKLRSPDACTAHDYPENTVLIAEDLAPTDTLLMDITRITGFVTRRGGKTSHAAILARSKGIPAVVGAGDIIDKINDGDTIILDGTGGLILINPDDPTRALYTQKRQQFIGERAWLKSLREVPAVTRDGQEVHLRVNISSAGDLEQMEEYGGEGVGLFRTEMLFMGRDTLPSEEEQIDFYKPAVIRCKNLPLTIRTLDIGGDKQLSCFAIPPEKNPFLGYRGIRLCLDRKDIFLVQLKAILRASVFGKINIMFPMISCVQEIRQALSVLAQAKAELQESSITFDNNIAVGIMIEIPAAAAMADILAREVDFFSIGTNDLCQYSMAVDRMNEKVQMLYDPFNPGLLRLIKNCIDQAHKHQIRVGMCGEMASDPLATLLLLGMGLDEFSMNATSIPAVKNGVINNTVARAREICENVMQMEDSETIKSYLERSYDI